MVERQRSVSVVVSTHRRPHLLARALDSVLCQTLPPVEVIVVDDADDDETARVVARFAARAPMAVRYLVNRAANGPSGSRNLGAASASGALLAFLDDDDQWAPGYLAQAVACVDGADVVVTPLLVTRVDAGGRLVHREVRTLDVTAFGERVLAQNPGVTGSNVVIDADVFARCGGYDEDLWIGEDNEFLARLLRSGARIRATGDSLVRQVEHTGARLSTGGQRRADGYRNLLRKTYVVAPPGTRRRLAFHYFDARKDAAAGTWARWRYRLYAWSLAERRDFTRRARLRLAALPRPRPRPAVRT